MTGPATSSNPDMPRAAALERVLLALWVGGLWAIGFLAAPTLFAVVAERSQAGSIAGALFGRMAVLGLIIGVLLLALWVWREGRVPWRGWRFWAVVAMLTITIVGAYGLQPAIQALRDAGAVGTPGFRRLHGAASLLFLISSLIGLTLVAAGPRDAGR